MKKLRLLAVLLAAVSVLTFVAAGAEGTEAETPIPPETPVTYGYLEVFGEKLRSDILSQVGSGTPQAGGYRDETLPRGSVILLSENTELIFRGGSAVVITSSGTDREGVADLSSGRELYSGESLEFAHIYHISAGESRRAVLVTGGKAYFTVRGDYEVR